MPQNLPADAKPAAPAPAEQAQQEVPAQEVPPWQQNLRETLKPLTEWMPGEVRDQAPVEAWWLVELVLLLAVLLVIGTVLKKIGARFARKPKERDWDAGFREDLESLPMPVQPAWERVLAVYHLPVRIRLVVVAPMGKEARISRGQVPQLLNRVFPELGDIVAREEPAIRLWEAQISDLGFIAAFHRRTPTPDPEGEPSHWVLIAGRATINKQPFLVGLALYSDQPSTIGRLTLQPLQWLEVLRLRTRDESPAR